VFRNTKTRSRNHCCRGETISITNSECMSAALVIQHAPYYYTAICGLSGSTIFFPHYLLKKHDFRGGWGGGGGGGGGEANEHKMCVLISSTQSARSNARYKK